MPAGKGRYVYVKTQCTIHSVVQIFRLEKVIQKKRYVEKM